MKSMIAYLYTFNRAENRYMWEGINQLSSEQWLNPHEYSRGSIQNHIVHVMYTTTRWTYGLRGFGSMPPLEPAVFPEIAPAYLRWQELWGEIDSYVLGLSNEELAERVPWGLPRRGLNGAAPLWQLLLHLVNHALDHRVQVMMLLQDVFNLAVEKEMPSCL
jgi:uncharacterized damage-inducible protein DinB